MARTFFHDILPGERQAQHMVKPFMFFGWRRSDNEVNGRLFPSGDLAFIRVPYLYT